MSNPISSIGAPKIGTVAHGLDNAAKPEPKSFRLHEKTRPSRERVENPPLHAARFSPLVRVQSEQTTEPSLIKRFEKKFGDDLGDLGLPPDIIYELGQAGEGMTLGTKAAAAIATFQFGMLPPLIKEALK